MDTEGDQIVFRDVLFMLVGFLIIITVMFLFLINEPTKKAEEEIEKQAGNLNVEIVWNENVKADVDLWVKAPGLPPVGYSNKSNTLLNLVRDDLGEVNDLLNVNYENIFSRGIISGTYTVNVHLYSSRDKPPINIKVNVSFVDKNGVRQQLLFRGVKLERLYQEITVFSFILDSEGRLVFGSVDYVPVNIVREQNPMPASLGR